MAIDMNRSSAGITLPAAISTEIMGATARQSAVMAASRQIPLPGLGATVPVLTGEPTAGWANETDDKPVSKPGVTTKPMTGYTLAVIVPFSNQFRRDVPALYDALVRQLPGALAKRFDETVFGATAPGDHFDTLGSAPAVVIDGTETYKDAVAAFQAIAAQNNGATLTHWLASPALQGTLMGATLSTGAPLFQNVMADGAVGSLLGRPVLDARVSMAAGATGFAGDFANRAVWGSVEGVQISISDQATLTDGETQINLWQRNMFAVRAEIEVGFRVANINDFVMIKAAA